MKIDPDKINRIIAALDQHIEEAEKATAGPWLVDNCRYGFSIENAKSVITATQDEEGRYGAIHDEADAAFIAQARTMSPLACQSLKIAIQGLMNVAKNHPSGECVALQAILDLWPSP